jgi:hypothetical protein
MGDISKGVANSLYPAQKILPAFFAETLRYRGDFHTISRSLGMSTTVPVLFVRNSDQCFGPDSVNPDLDFLVNLDPEREITKNKNP